MKLNILIAVVATLIIANGEAHALNLQEHADTLPDNTSDEAGLPLEGSRSVTINTNEGTWLSVDVHPDGRTLVFDLLGDLYTIPIEGGDATRITDGLAFDCIQTVSLPQKMRLCLTLRSTIYIRPN